MPVETDSYITIYRRFVRRNGRLLDAWQYGHQAWPIRILLSKYRPPAQMELGF